MNTLDAIRNRASIKKFSQQSVEKELIEQCLELAVWAPNHRMTEPWRFFVLREESRERLIEIMATDFQSDRNAVENFGKKLKSAPVMILIYSLPGKNLLITKENYAATCAAVQNLLLAAYDLGLSTIWRTGEYYESLKMKEFIGIQENAEFVGAIHMGYSDQIPDKRKRTSFAEVTNWV